MIKIHQQFELFGKKIFEKAVLEPPFRLIAQMPDEACFYYLARGQSAVYTPTAKLSIDRNEGMVLQCGTYLNEYLSREENEYCEAIAVHFYPDVLKMIYDKEFPDFLLNLGKIKPLKYERVKASVLLTKYIDNLQFYFENPELVSEELLKIKLKEIILLLAKTDNAQAIKELIESLFSKTEVNFKDVIEANLYNRLNLEELAALTHLSLSSFKREFVKHYACPPARYIRQRRVEKAAKLLKNTTLRISDIAFDCGFVELAHFSKTFHKGYGMSPKQYRLD